MTVLFKISLSMFLEIPDESEKKSGAPVWLDKSEYPFDPHFYGWNGEKLHYVDEGTGSPLVLLHGNPTWSFMYRNFIKRFSEHYRCIALDYPGFGLSTLRNDITYGPDKIARSVTQLIQHLKLRNISLILHDWGGPIGMWYAVNHPGNIASIIVMNSWTWPLNGQLRFELFSRLMSGPPGRYLISQYNIIPRLVMKFGFCNPAHFSPKIQKHYIRPFDEPGSRKPQWTLASCLLESSQWLHEIWEKKKLVENIPAMFIWGMRDPMFAKKVLSKWSKVFESNEEVRLKRAGHFVPEEIGDAEMQRIKDFLISAYS